MSADAQEVLRARQIELVRALTHQDAAPSGFDLAQVRVARRQIDLKRWRVMAKLWPAVAADAEAACPDDALRLVCGEPRAHGHSALADGLRLAGWLQRTGRLRSPAAIRELAIVDVVWALRNGILVRRRLPRVAIRPLPDGRLMVAAQIARRWAYVFEIPKSVCVARLLLGRVVSG